MVAVRTSRSYKVFLDQYVLTAAAPHAIALGEALDASAGAVRVWFGFYVDFDWCKQEFAKLETMQNLKRGFRYVIARIDGLEIWPRGNEAVDRFFQTARGSRWQRAAFAAVWAERSAAAP